MNDSASKAAKCVLGEFNACKAIKFEDKEAFTGYFIVDSNNKTAVGYYNREDDAIYLSTAFGFNGKEVKCLYNMHDIVNKLPDLIALISEVVKLRRTSAQLEGENLELKTKLEEFEQESNGIYTKKLEVFIKELKELDIYIGTLFEESASASYSVENKALTINFASEFAMFNNPVNSNLDPINQIFDRIYSKEDKLIINFLEKDAIIKEKV